MYGNSPATGALRQDTLTMPTRCLGILEVKTLTASMMALDALEKAGDVRVIQSELNDLGGVCVKVTGEAADVEAGLAAAKALAQRFRAECVTHIIRAPSAVAWPAIEGPPEYTPLMESNIVFFPCYDRRYEPVSQGASNAVAESKATQPPVPAAPAAPATETTAAIGFIETQGYTAVIEAIDTACKSGNVEVLGREKLGGGFITVVIRGDVAAVKAAVEAGRGKVEGLGKLIAAHVIARPSAGVLALLPRA